MPHKPAKKRSENLRTILGGFQDSLNWLGFFFKKKYHVELWKWETMADEDVCEDCLDRATWPAMDIADWMEDGLPGSDEAHTQCHKKCRCQLVRYIPHEDRGPPNF